MEGRGGVHEDAGTREHNVEGAAGQSAGDVCLRERWEEEPSAWGHRACGQKQLPPGAWARWVTVVWSLGCKVVIQHLKPPPTPPLPLPFPPARGPNGRAEAAPGPGRAARQAGAKGLVGRGERPSGG